MTRTVKKLEENFALLITMGPFSPLLLHPYSILSSSCPITTSSSLLKDYPNVFGACLVDESLSAGPIVPDPFHISRSSSVFLQINCLQKIQKLFVFCLRQTPVPWRKAMNSLPTIHYQVYETVANFWFGFGFFSPPPTEEAFMKRLFLLSHCGKTTQLCFLTHNLDIHSMSKYLLIYKYCF